MTIPFRYTEVLLKIFSFNTLCISHYGNVLYYELTRGVLTDLLPDLRYSGLPTVFNKDLSPVLITTLRVEI